MSPTKRDLLIGLVVIAVAAVLPWLGPSNYQLRVLVLLFIYGTVVTQWNLVFGVGGIFSLAQMALFSVGGFSTAMLATFAGWSVWPAMFAGAAVTVMASLLIGIACLRLKGPYVALLTLAIALVMQLMVLTDTKCFQGTGPTCIYFTGGVAGFSRFGDLGFAKLLGRGNWLMGEYYVGAVLFALATLFSILVIRSPYGVAFRALRDNPAYAVARGLSRFKYQLLLFLGSSLFTGLAGGFYAAHFRVFGPTLLNLSLLLFLLAMMVIGGLGRMWGPLLGTALVLAVDEPLKDFVDYRNIGLGILIIVFAVLWPHGVAGAIEYWVARLRRLWSGAGARRPAAPPAPPAGD